MKKINFFFAALGIAAMMVGCTKGEEDSNASPFITPDPEAITEIACDSPADQSIMIKSNVNWVIQCSSEWVTIDPIFGPAGNTIVTVKIASNYVNEKTDRAARQASIDISGSGIKKTVTVSQLGYTAPKEEKLGGISTAAELKECIEMINAGGNYEKWCNNDGELAILADIDLSGEKTWAPLGLAKQVGTSFKGAVSLVGVETAFNGTINGNGHKITGIDFTFNTAEVTEYTFFGLFGYMEGAKIKNLIVGKEGDKITITGPCPTSFGAAGVLGGGNDVTITGVTNYVDVIFDGTSDAAQFGMAGIISNGISCTIGSEAAPVVNYGDIYCKAKISLAQAGEGGHMVGGIQGFMKFGTIQSCSNHGVVSCATGRGGGIVASINNQATADNPGKVISCTNYGTVCRDFMGTSPSETSNNKRMAGILGGAEGWYNVIDGCVNEGNVIAESKCRCGGIAGHSKIQIKNCENKGAIISDSDGTHGPGWLCGYCDTYANAIKGCNNPNVSKCKMGGKVGDYTTYGKAPETAPAATIDNTFGYNNKPMESDTAEGSFLLSEIIL